MTTPFFSEDHSGMSWSETTALSLSFGPKGARLAALPKKWVPPFILVPALLVKSWKQEKDVYPEFWQRVNSVIGDSENVIVRSSVIGESIWERGSYKSIVLPVDSNSIKQKILKAFLDIADSAPGKHAAVVIQRYIKPKDRGEFGNLFRISRTRDHWELSSLGIDGEARTVRFNTQRDMAANPNQPLIVKSGLNRERMFASIAAWINNDLVRGTSVRLNCEWVTDNSNFYIVQIDEEDEDVCGINPHQITTTPSFCSINSGGKFLRFADASAFSKWDKLKVLGELWGEDATNRPSLYYLELRDVEKIVDDSDVSQLTNDFSELIGQNNIVVRISVRAEAEKITNLPRTDCLTPEKASCWCLEQAKSVVNSGVPIDNFAFIVHRYIHSTASAWSRAEVDDPVVEIHSLWGLPDALQYCAYDTWEVHIPTEAVTEYTEYKSHILVPQDQGEWKYTRVKNEVARGASIRKIDAIDVARRSHSIAKKIGRSCHIMWFVGCTNEDGKVFNLPWYWTEAHDTEKNVERWTHRVFKVDGRESLEKFIAMAPRNERIAIELCPDHPDLMRDNSFIASVSKAASEANVPVILEGSTLAHAYYQLRLHGCTVVSPSGKERTKIRKNMFFGKLVRDKIPERIADRKEVSITTSIDPAARQPFLLGKLIEEAIEVREATNIQERVMELADLYEVFRGLVSANGLIEEDVRNQANIKRDSVGGFDSGVLLLQTGILGRGRQEYRKAEKPLVQVLSRRLDGDTYEIPFTFFGFVGVDEPHVISFSRAGIHLQITLKTDRIALRVIREPVQLELDLELDQSI